MRWGPRTRSASLRSCCGNVVFWESCFQKPDPTGWHKNNIAQEMWYFGRPPSIFPFWGKFSQIFCPFLEHFCYMLRNGLGNNTCLKSVNCIFFLNCSIFGPKNSFFSFQAQPQLVSFWPKKSFFFFFFLKIAHFLPLHFIFPPIFCPKVVFSS